MFKFHFPRRKLKSRITLHCSRAIITGMIGHGLLLITAFSAGFSVVLAADTGFRFPLIWV